MWPVLVEYRRNPYRVSWFISCPRDSPPAAQLAGGVWPVGCRSCSAMSPFSGSRNAQTTTTTPFALRPASSMPRQPCLLSVPFDCEQNFREPRRGFSTHPVALQFTRHLDPAYRLRAGLRHALHCRTMGLQRSAANCIHDGIHLVAVTKSIESWKGQTGLGPQRSHYQLLAPGGLNRSYKLLVFPCVDSSSIQWLGVGQDCLQLMNCWRVLAGFHIHRREYDGKLKQLSQARHGNDIGDKDAPIHRCNRCNLHRLIVDHDER